ncbi:MAG: hypothetical protein WDM76_06745 [Limisphaerales bacterium]
MIRTFLKSSGITARFLRYVANFINLFRLGIATLVLCGCFQMASGATVTLLTSDAADTSSITGATNWSNGQVPSAANDYFVGAGLTIRTPATQSSAYTFAGNSLTIRGTFGFKMTNIITVADLRLTNGFLQNTFAGGNPNMGAPGGEYQCNH